MQNTIDSTDFLVQGVEADQEIVRLLYGSLAWSMIATILNTGILSAIQWSVIDHITILLWWILMALLSISRIALSLAFKKSIIEQASAEYWRHLYVFGSYVSGVLWAAAGIVLFPPDDISHQALLAFVIAGMSAGSVATQSADKSVVYGFLSLILLPLIYSFFATGTDNGIAMGAMVALYYLVLLTAATRMNYYITHKLHLAIEREQANDTLQRNVRTLSELHRITSNASASLAEKIQHILALGIEVIELPGAIVSRFDGVCYEVMYSSNFDGTLKPGLKSELVSDGDKLALAANNVMGFHDTELSDAKIKPTYQKLKIAAYMSAPIYVGGVPYGVLSFYATAPRVSRFNRHDFALVQLLAQWVGNEIERYQSEQALRDSKFDLRSIFNSAYDAIFVIDLTGRLIDVNERALQMFGVDYNRAISFSFIPDAQNKQTRLYFPEHIWTRLNNGENCLFEWQAKRFDNAEVFDVEMYVRQITLRNKQVVLANVRDITERKNVEHMKNEFISTVSHELRTPLTSIKGTLGLLRGDVAGKLSGEAKELVNIAERNSERLLGLINDLLDVEKIAAGRMTFSTSRYDIMLLVSHALEENKSFAKDFHVKLKLIDKVEDVSVLVDELRFGQVLSNLLSNAAKFSGGAAEVEISVKCHGSNVRVSVIDHGVGVPAEFKNRIFDKFSQADSSDTRQIGGTGLGLNISKTLIEKMNGTIGYHSILGKGSTFFIELPVAP